MERLRHFIKIVLWYTRFWERSRSVGIHVPEYCQKYPVCFCNVCIARLLSSQYERQPNHKGTAAPNHRFHPDFSPCSSTMARVMESPSPARPHLRGSCITGRKLWEFPFPESRSRCLSRRLGQSSDPFQGENNLPIGRCKFACIVNQIFQRPGQFSAIRHHRTGQGRQLA